MRPVGLIDPRTGQRPFAVVQLRQDNHEATLYNLVGFQTKMTYPGAAPRVAHDSRAWSTPSSCASAACIATPSSTRRGCCCRRCSCARGRETFVAGQLIGVEGYVESAAAGLLAAINAARLLRRPAGRRAAGDHRARLAAALRHRPARAATSSR